MSIAMVVTLMPAEAIGAWGGAGKVKAAATAKVLDADKLATTSGNFSVDTTYGDFTVMANSNKGASIAAVSSLSGYTGLDSYTNVVKITGGGMGQNQNPDGSFHVVNAIKFSTDGAATVEVYAASKSSGEKASRQIKIVKATEDDSDLGEEVAVSEVEGGLLMKLEKIELTIPEAGSYYLGFSSDGGVIPYLSVTEEDSSVTEVSVDVTTTTHGLLPEGSTIKLFSEDAAKGTNDGTGDGAGDGIDVTQANAKKLTLKVGTYKTVIKDKDGKVVEGLAAKLNGEDSIRVNAQTTALEIDVVTTVLKLTPTITGSDLGALKVVARAGDKAYELSNGVEVTLPKNTKFTVSVEDANENPAESWVVKVGDGDNTFTTTEEETQAITVDAKSVSEVLITPRISGRGLLGANKLYFVNADDANEKHAVTDGEALSLKPNAKYKVVLETEAGAAVTGLVAMIGAGDSFETDLKDAEIVVSVSTPVTHTTEYDFTNNVAGTPEIGGKLKTEYDILYMEKGSSSGCSLDANQLRFRIGVMLYIPIADDTTKVTYAQTCKATNAGRPTYVGAQNSGYELECSSEEVSATIDDIEPYVKEVNGKRYFPIISGGDVKIAKMRVIEYSPVNSVTVTGTLPGAHEKGVDTIFFTNLDNDQAEIVEAPIKEDDSFEVVLKRVNGETRYAATIAATGLKIEDKNDADKFTLIGNDATATVNLTIGEAPIVKISGTLVGVDDEKLVGELGLKLVPDNVAMKPIEVPLTKTEAGYSFADVTVEYDRVYTPVMSNADDFEIKNTLSIGVNDSTTVTITAAAKPVYKVSGKFVTSNDKASDVTKITFKNMDTPEYSYTANVTGNTYEIDLREATYVTSVESGEFEAFDHVKVEDAAVENDIYLMGEVDNSPVDYKPEVTVGATGRDFTTISDAVAYISRMTRTPNQRVTIALDNGTYREQLVIDTPNITIKGNGSTLTWYYGVGFSYYSAKLEGNSAYYDEAYAVDKYEKAAISQNPGHWGATVNLLAGAKGFAAEDLTFENSLNRYITEEELADGADENVSPAITRRTAQNIDVRTNAAKERACVIYIQADNTEYKNCQFLSRQDTIYTGDATENSYFKDCVIEGTVDFICGDGNPVFDACDLKILGYSYNADNAKEKETYENYKGSYIVANKAKANHGYLFNDCKISASVYDGVGTTSESVLARAWDAGTVYWMNTELEAENTISATKPYLDMNAKAADAHYNEWNTHVKGSSTPIDVSKRTAGYTGKTMTAEEAATVVTTDFFDDWRPSYFEGDYAVEVAKLNLTVEAPAAEETISREVSTAQPGVILGGLKWFADGEEVVYDKFSGNTVYSATVVVSLETGYKFADEVKAEVTGAVETTVTKNENGTVTVTAVYEKTGSAGYYVIDITKGLYTNKTYANGIMTVLADMTYDAAKGPFVKGGANPKPNNGAIPTAGTSLKFVAPADTGDGATTRVTIKSKSSNKVFYLVRDDGGEATVVDSFTGGSDPVSKSYVLDPGKTYYYYASGSNQEIYEITVEHRVIVRGAWADVAAPTIENGTVDGEDASKINVVARGLVGDEGADALVVDMMDTKGDVVDTKTSILPAAAEEDITFTFTPSVSGKYSFRAHLDRDGEVSKYSKETDILNFIAPLATPNISSVTNKGLATAGNNATAKLEVIWYKVAEARKYVVSVIKKAAAEGEQDTILKSAETTALEYTFDGLTVGDEVTVSVVAVRAGENDKSKPGEEKVTITGEFNTTWTRSSYGTNADKSDTVTKNADGSITVDAKSSTKIVPGSTDGLLYYYTKLNANDNFVLTAKMKMDQYEASNGQEGFGIMAADAVGEHGDGTAFWNNSYQLAVTKQQYNWDPTIKNAAGRYVGGLTTLVSDSETIFQNKMMLGIGWISKTGVTLVDKQKIANGEIATPTGWSSGTQGTLETSIAQAVMDALYAEGKITDNSTPEEVQAAYKNYEVQRAGDIKTSYGEFNIMGNTKGASTNLIKKVGAKEFTPITEVIMQIRRCNAGYVMTYLDNEVTTDAADGKTVLEIKNKAGEKENHKVIGSKVLYDDARNSLTQIDKKNIYVGFFAARKTKATVDYFDLEIIDPDEDPYVVEKVKEEVLLNTRILSGNTSNSENYDLVFTANADGALSVINKANNRAVAQNLAVTSGKRVTIGTKLVEGANELEVVFTPDPDYTPGENQVLVYEGKSVKLSHVVTYKVMDGEIIYVAPNGTGDGSDKSAPTDIFTAVNYAKAGQKIYMAGETYNLGMANNGADKVLRFERGNDGAKGNYIYLQTDPSDVAAGKRAVLDFKGCSQTGSAVQLVASYWYFKDFDVTHSKNGVDGIKVSGMYNVLENLHTYENGNTGIQIARDGSDGRALWPAYNLILNCNSYMNYDEGYEDADGFAAKQTVGDGNRFLGCVSAYNADDGWDLFAKVQTGNIGVVTIENCVAYKNGYLLGTDKTADSPAIIDYAGAEFPAGNGNGFKMGGDGLSGYHVLKNSVAYGNKANGIDSNSCPDIQVSNCVSYANKAANIALSNYATSVNTDYSVKGVVSVNGGSKESITTRGTQVMSKIYNATNYFWNGTASVNAADKTKTIDASVFVSVDPKAAGIDPANGSIINRDANGSIVLGDFLKLKDDFVTANPGVGGAPAPTVPSEVLSSTLETAVFANSVKTVGEIALPQKLKDSGYSWKYPETLTASFAGASVEVIAVDKDGNEASVIVHFVEVTGVELVADGDALYGEGEITLTAKPVYTPSELPVELSEITGANWTFTFTDKGKMGLSGDTTYVEGTEGLKNAVTLRRQSSSKEGLAKYTATMQIKTGKTTVKKTSTAVPFATRNTAYEFEYTLSGDAKEEDGVIIVDGAAKTFNLENLKVSGLSNDAVKVSVGDTKVVKYDASGFKAMNAGSTYILLTAAADKTVVKSIPVTVMGAAYKTNVSMITLDRAKTSGVMFKALNDPADVVVKKVIKGAKTVLKGNEASTGDEKSLRVENSIGDFYTLTVVDKDEDGKSVDMIKTGSYTVILADSAGVEFEPVVVKIIETKPIATFKQSKKVNLYYSAGTNNNTGFVTATSRLAGVTVSQVNADNDDYKLLQNGKGYDLVLKNSAADKYQHGSRINNKVAVKVSFNGYKSAYDKDMYINVSTEDRAPKYVLEIDNKVFYTQLDITDTEIRVFNKTTGTYVTDAEVKLADSTRSYVKANASFLLDETAGTYTLTTTKSGTARISVIDPEFGLSRKGIQNEVILNAPITINNRKPTAVFGKISLSALPEYAGYEQASALVTVRNAMDYTVRDLELDAGNNAKAKALLPYLNYEVDEDEFGRQVLLVTLQDGADKTIAEAIQAGIIKAGSYSYTAKFKLNRLSDLTSKVTVSLNAKATASAKVKGSLDLINRTGSKLTVKATVKNLNGNVVGMRLGDDKKIAKTYKAEFAASNLFDVAWDSSANAAIVTLKEDADYRANGKYKVTPIFTVATPNGEVEITANPITIVTKQSTVKFAAIPVMEARLSNTETPASTVLTPKAPSAVEMDNMKQLSGTENFDVEYDPQSGNLDVYIVNRNGLKAGKTYTIKLAVTPVGASAGAKQQIISVKVKVLH